MKYSEAVTKAVKEQLETDDSLYIFGQDIVEWGGYGGIFADLAKQYRGNFYDTPIAEAGVTGVGIGMAMKGKRVLIEYAFMDFMLHAMDQIVSNASKIEFFSNGEIKLPITFYTTISSGRKYGATHSQSLEYIFANVPGLQVLYPTNPTDAYSMLKEALNADRPTLFVTHKILLDNTEVFETLESRRPRLVSSGDKLTVVTYGRAREIVSSALNSASIDGVEVLDLRYLTDIDFDSIKSSISKTGKLLVVEEGYGAISLRLLGKLAVMCNNLNVKYYSLESEFESIGLSNEYEVVLNENSVVEMVKKLL